MLFQTFEFFILMGAVLLAIALIRTHTLQLLLLLVASYIFYMSWNPAFIILIIYSTLNDYIVGLALGRTSAGRWRIFWLAISCVTNLGLLAVFKYFNFFIESANQLLVWVDADALLPVMKITLPVGISFYTFQSMSYTIDVYRKRLQPERSFLRFALYVAFFPQLVAGPILRSTQFLPQLHKTVRLQSENLRAGLHLFLCGIVKKVIVADNVGPFADYVFGNPHGLPSIVIMAGALAFGIQIYCDFSGYTDMARGVGRVLGYDIMLNFNYPYFARSITDFWRRWHISLSSWLRDYLYIPLGGNRKGTVNTYRNLLMTMGLGGLWHGAGWNFVAWGMYQGLLLAFERVIGVGARKTNNDESPARRRIGHTILRLSGVLVAWLICQYLVLLGWVLFRVRGWDNLIYCVRKYVVFDCSCSTTSLGLGNVNPFLVFTIILGFMVIHLCSFRCGSLASRLNQFPRWGQWLVYLLTIFMLIWFWPQEQTAFIYFQF